MSAKDFDYRGVDSSRITNQLLFADARFDIRDVIKGRKEDFSPSVTILTPSQRFSVAFNYDNVPGGHADIADMMLGRLYPGYESARDLSVYDRNRSNNAFILTVPNSDVIITFMPSVISKTQLDNFIDYVNKLRDTDYIRRGNGIKVGINQSEFFLDQAINIARQRVGTTCIPTQFNIEGVRKKFGRCSNDGVLSRNIDQYVRSCGIPCPKFSPWEHATIPVRSIQPPLKTGRKQGRSKARQGNRGYREK